MFVRNFTLDRALFAAMRERGYGVIGAYDIVGKTMRLSRPKRQELERQLTEFVSLRMNASDGAIVDGVFVGNWLDDLLQFIIDNWEVILEIILTIINIFMSEE